MAQHQSLTPRNTLKRDIKYTTASRTKLIVKSDFKGYDLCLNPYVGCSFGCKYCYVRFFIKDDEKPWGEFVRMREHVKDKLPRELAVDAFRVADGREPVLDDEGNPVLKENGNIKTKPKHRLVPREDARLVLGTMTDPYQPVEKKVRITRKALQLIGEAGLNKVGIFTRSPIIADDIDLIRTLPRARVHFTISPWRDSVIKKIEPIGIAMRRRWKTIQALKDAGIRVHVNVAPAVPLFSEELTEDIAKQLAACKVDEFFVDPMQPYEEAFVATAEAMADEPDWPLAAEIMSDKPKYLKWKEQYRKDWFKAWKDHGSEGTLPIWSDHENHVWVDMRTGESMDPRAYGDDLEE